MWRCSDAVPRAESVCASRFQVSIPICASDCKMRRASWSRASPFFPEHESRDKRTTVAQRPCSGLAVLRRKTRRALKVHPSKRGVVHLVSLSRTKKCQFACEYLYQHKSARRDRAARDEAFRHYYAQKQNAEPHPTTFKASPSRRKKSRANNARQSAPWAEKRGRDSSSQALASTPASRAPQCRAARNRAHTVDKMDGGRAAFCCWMRGKVRARRTSRQPPLFVDEQLTHEP